MNETFGREDAMTNKLKRELEAHQAFADWLESLRRGFADGALQRVASHFAEDGY